MNDPPITFAAPLPLAVAAGLLAAAVALGVARRIRLPRGAAWIGVVGLVALAAAAGSPAWRRPVAGEVAVMVDLSASTRTAAYRDRAALTQRIDALLGSTPHRVYLFTNGTPIPDDGRPLSDLPSDRTTFAPPPAPAVLLFSDGRFPPPASAAPAFAVIDPALLAAADSRVATLRVDGGDATARVASALPRSMTWSGTAGGRSDAVSAGGGTFRRPLAVGAKQVSAKLSPGDPWPENDGLTAGPPPPVLADRWFVTAGGAAPPGFVRVAPAELPTDAGAYLSVAAIVLDNLAAADVPPAARDRVAQYAGDLGGGLLILGGDRAFAAGAYVNTRLEALSPLASVPPRPAAHWVLLADGSGSMNEAAAAGGATRWQSAVAALARAVAGLPPEDPVDVGSFAADVAWWSAGRPAAATAKLPFPPPGVSPTGPTNLAPALAAAIGRHDPALPGHVLLLTDADAEAGDVAALVERLKAKRLTLHLLAIGDGRGLADLSRAARESGGSVVRQDEAGRWAEAATELLAGAAEKRVSTSPVDVTFAGPLASLGRRDVAPWNRTWLKPRATELAATALPQASGGGGGEDVPMAAAWQVGEGRVAAAAFRPAPAELAALVAQVARPPRDPRVTVEWDAGPTLRVQVDAADPAAAATQPYLNGRSLTVELTGDGVTAERHPFPQVGPGRYEAELPAPTSPRLAAVRDGDRVVARFAVPGRYPPEFDAVGVDRAALESLTSGSGGRVIEPGDAKPIDFRWPREAVPLTPWVATSGAVLVLAALVWWRAA